MLVVILTSPLMDDMQTPKSIKYFLMASIAFTLMATDLYLPAMPMMVEDLQSSTNMVQYTISVYLFGLALFAVFYGPVSDALGRKKTYMMGLTLFLISSIALVITNSIELLLVFRFLQGCGAASSSISAAVVNDSYSNSESGKIIAQMSMVIVLSPAIAPTIGGYISAYLGWRMCFLVITLAAAILWVCFYFYFPETHSHEKRTEFRVKKLVSNYKAAFKRSAFMTYVIMHSLPSCALWCLMTVQPFVYITEMNVKTEHFGYYIGSLILLHSATSYVVQRIITRTGPTRLMPFGIAFMLLSCIFLILASQFAPHSALLATLGIAPFMMGVPIIFPTAISKALTYVRDISGTGAATISVSRQGFGFLGSVAGGLLTDISLMPTAIFMLFMVISIIGLYFLSRRIEGRS